MPYLKLHASMRHSLCKGWTPKMFLLTNGEYFLKNLFCALCVFLQGFVINDTSDLAGRILKAPAQSRLFRSVSSCVYQCIRGWPSSLASCSIATKTPCSSKTYWHRLRVKSSVKLQTLLWIFNPRWRDFHVCKTPPVPRNVTFIFVILQHKVEPEGKTIICQSQRVWDGGKTAHDWAKQSSFEWVRGIKSRSLTGRDCVTAGAFCSGSTAEKLLCTVKCNLNEFTKHGILKRADRWRAVRLC